MGTKKKNSKSNRRVDSGDIIWGIATGVLVVIIIILLIYAVRLVKGSKNDRTDRSAAVVAESIKGEDPVAETSTPTPTPTPEPEPVPVFSDGATGDMLYSDYGLMMRASTGEVLFDKNGYTTFFPASITKVMTCMITLENVPNLDETFTVITEDLEPCYYYGASMAGFQPGDTVTIRDLLYGAMLPSGGECCFALARRVAGSEAGMAELMNQKAAEIGMTQTHFVTVTGLHDDNHYTTCYDLALMMKWAIQNPLFREIASTSQYISTPNESHPEGMTINGILPFVLNGAFEEPNGAVISGGKTGTTDEARRCLATFGTFEGEDFVCITLGAPQNTELAENYNGVDAHTIYGALSVEYVTP